MDEPIKKSTGTRYRAFICYSQQDRAAVEKLHRRLESYRVPRRLIGKPGKLGAIPERLSPVFRDCDELAASADIGQRLHDALECSDFLVVLCSPISAQSRWVNAEIELFRTLHPGNQERVLAVILAGDPDAVEPSINCFPRALRLENASAKTLGLNYPLAADFRPGRDRRTDAELRLIAALLGVEFDELKRREVERRIRQLRLWLAMSAALGLAFAALAVFAYAQWQQAQRSAARAANARIEAEKLIEFMLFDLRPKLEVIGKLNILESTSEKVQAYYETVAPEENNPDILRRRAAVFHQSALDLRSHENGQKTMSMLAAAVAMRERLIILNPRDADARLALADTRRILANQRQDAGDSQGALREIGLAMAQAEQAVLLRPNDRNAVARLASLHTEEAESLIRTGQTAIAATRLEKALMTLENLLTSDENNLELKNRTATAAWKLGYAYRRLSDFVRAEKSFRRSIQLANTLKEAAPSNIVYLRWYQLSLSSLGNMMNEAGRTDEALQILQKSLSVSRDIVSIEPSSQVHLTTLATTLSQISAALCNLDRTAEAMPFAREQVELLEGLVAKGNAYARTRSNFAMALVTYGITLQATGNSSDAIAVQKKAVRVQREISEADPSDLKMRDDLGYAHARLAFTLSEANASDEAAAEFRTAIAVMDEILAKETKSPQLVRRGERAQWQFGLGVALRARGAIDEAKQTLLACIAAIDQAVAEGLPPTAQAQTRKKAEAELQAISTSTPPKRP